jgi:hypothetical protein
MEQHQILEQLQGIKGIIEERTRFRALSGLSAVAAGIIALIGAFMANYYIYHSDTVAYQDVKSAEYFTAVLIRLVWVAIITLVSAVSAGFYFSYRNAQRAGTSLLSPAGRRLIYNFWIPMMAGGIFTLVILYRGYYDLIVPVTLIFYGLSVFTASHYTHSDVRKLGIALMLTGCAAFFMPTRGVYLWAFGFGVLHIVYGTIMYYKYEK